MDEANKGFGCMAAFGGVFAAAGVVSIFAGARGMWTGQENAWVACVVGGIFTLIGLGIVAGGVVGRRRVKWELLRKQERPAEPWRWKKEWDGGRIADASYGAARFLWGFAIFWNVIAFPIAGAVGLRGTDIPWWGNLIVAIFPLIGIAMVIGAIRATARSKRLGQSFLQLRTYPAILGNALAGELQTGRPMTFVGPITARLVCVRQTKTGSGDDESTHENILWEDEQLLAGHFPSDLEHTRIPIHVKLPTDPPQSDWSDSRNQVIWRLTLNGDSSFERYSARFDVPVFQVPNSPNHGMIEDHAAKFRQQGTAMRGPGDERIVVMPRVDGGVEFDFPAGRFPVGRWIVLVLFLIFGGISCGMIYYDSSILFGVIFGFISLILIVASWCMTVFRTHVIISRGEIISQTFLFPFRWERRAYKDDITTILSKITTQIGDKAFYTISVVSNGKPNFNAGSGVTKRDAEWLIERMNEALRK